MLIFSKVERVATPNFNRTLIIDLSFEILLKIKNTTGSTHRTFRSKFNILEVPQLQCGCVTEMLIFSKVDRVATPNFTRTLIINISFKILLKIKYTTGLRTAL